MLFSLISVLVLVVIAFYALWIGVMGHVNGNEGPELSLGGRVVVVAVALLAFVSAYLVYSRSGDAPAALVASAPAAAVPPPSLPKAAAVIEPTEMPVDKTSTAEKMEAPLTETSEAATEPAVQAAAEPESDGVLSASAALMESEVRGKAALPPPPRPANTVVTSTVTPATVRPAPEVLPSKPAAPKARRAPRTRAAGPLVLHLDNTLGRDQRYEHLTLSIEGRVVAQFEVDDRTPRSQVSVQLPRAGLLNYRLEGISEAGGATQLVGVGCIPVRDGSRYVVRRKPGSQKVFLEAARGAR